MLRMFNNPEELVWYIHEHPDFAATAARATYSSALSAEKELGYEDGYLPEMLRILSNGLSCLKDLGIWPDCEDIKVYRGVVIFDIEPDLDKPGICWSYDKQAAEDWVNELIDDDDPESAPCILTGITDSENIDWLMTVWLLSTCPEEKEIRLWSDDQTVLEVIDWEVI